MHKPHCEVSHSAAALAAARTHRAMQGQLGQRHVRCRMQARLAAHALLLCSALKWLRATTVHVLQPQ